MRFRCGICSNWPAELFEFEGDIPGVCPKCGAAGPPVICPLVDVHLLVRSLKGPIMGGHGRQFIACEPARQYLARVGGAFFSATGEPTAVTCPQCRGTPAFREMAMANEELRIVIAREEERRKSFVDLGEKK